MPSTGLPRHRSVVGEGGEEGVGVRGRSVVGEGGGRGGSEG